jgi:hypothetical protein
VSDPITAAVACWGAIDHLVGQPGDSVVITHAGLDYALQRSATVICHGVWTPPEGRTFTGDTHLHALAAAVDAYKEAARG